MTLYYLPPGLALTLYYLPPGLALTLYYLPPGLALTLYYLPPGLALTLYYLGVPATEEGADAGASRDGTVHGGYHDSRQHLRVWR